MDKKEHALAKAANGIWNKIKHMLFSIFGGKKSLPKTKDDSSQVYEDKHTKKQPDFVEEFGMQLTSEQIRILKIKQDFDAHLIEENDISKEDAEKIEELYQSQLRDLLKKHDMLLKKLNKINV